MILNLEKVKSFEQKNENCYILTLKNDVSVTIKKYPDILEIYHKSFVLSFNFKAKRVYLENIPKIYRESRYTVFESNLFKIKLFLMDSLMGGSTKIEIFFEDVFIFEDILHN